MEDAPGRPAAARPKMSYSCARPRHEKLKGPSIEGMHADIAQLVARIVDLQEFVDPNITPEVVVDDDSFRFLEHGTSRELFFYLFRVWNPKVAKEFFHGCYPVYEKKDESAFLKKCVQFIHQIRAESELAAAVVITPSKRIVMEPGGQGVTAQRFLDFLHSFLVFVLLHVTEKVIGIVDEKADLLDFFEDVKFEVLNAASVWEEKTPEAIRRPRAKDIAPRPKLQAMAFLDAELYAADFDAKAAEEEALRETLQGKLDILENNSSLTELANTDFAHVESGLRTCGDTHQLTTSASLECVKFREVLGETAARLSDLNSTLFSVPNLEFDAKNVDLPKMSMDRTAEYRSVVRPELKAKLELAPISWSYYKQCDEEVRELDSDLEEEKLLAMCRNVSLEGLIASARDAKEAYEGALRLRDELRSENAVLDEEAEGLTRQILEAVDQLRPSRRLGRGDTADANVEASNRLPWLPIWDKDCVEKLLAADSEPDQEDS